LVLFAAAPAGKANSPNSTPKDDKEEVRKAPAKEQGDERAKTPDTPAEAPDEEEAEEPTKGKAQGPAAASDDEDNDKPARGRGQGPAVTPDEREEDDAPAKGADRPAVVRLSENTKGETRVEDAGSWSPPTKKHAANTRPGIAPEPDHGRGGSRHSPPPPPPPHRPRRERHGHGYRHTWRHHWHGIHHSWFFLWHRGPVMYDMPVYVPHVVRLPRYSCGVYVRQTGDDEVGRDFEDALRDELRRKGLRNVWSADDAALELYIVSMDEDPEKPGFGSAISVSYIWRPGGKFITAQLLDCGYEQIDDLAEYVADYADDLVDRYR
jgi:hypothetical protein